jgi:hypothetical protein
LRIFQKPAQKNLIPSLKARLSQKKNAQQQHREHWPGREVSHGRRKEAQGKSDK